MYNVRCLLCDKLTIYNMIVRCEYYSELDDVLADYEQLVALTWLRDL